MLRKPRFFAVFGTFAFAGVTLFFLYFRDPSIAPDLPEPVEKPNIHTPIPTNVYTPILEAYPYDSGSDFSSHPIQKLVDDAQQTWEKTLKRQSKTLDEAVKEYRRRYGLPPPPHFDAWYAFAKSKNVVLIDEYDSIHASLTPFWGLTPTTIRGRAREALGFKGNSLIGVLIRNGSVSRIGGGGAGWQHDATVGMLKSFVGYLPDMDLAFNIHDEPRVVVPYGDLKRLVKHAKDIAMPAALLKADALENTWSQRPEDLGDGKGFAEVKTTRFNVFAHQSTWTHSRASCPPGSAARSQPYSDAPDVDDTSSYTATAAAAHPVMGFIANQTAFSDICNSPSLASTFGFFDRPNSFNLVQDLFPVFSQSKISSYSDILYPSPWYWADRVPYRERADTPWADKSNSMYWRGSTTGGFSRNGGWRRQHRQRIVAAVRSNSTSSAILTSSADSTWNVTLVPTAAFHKTFDVFFSHVGQCDPDDCNAQTLAFDIHPPADQQHAWRYKFLLDVDGNAFSGRFYAFLKSKSLTFKMALFREWHDEWLKPWVHYVPLTLQGGEWAEVVRWFGGRKGGGGGVMAERLAMESRKWAARALRNEDLEAWFFRLLLEYGRLVDDNRQNIGYSSPR